LNKIIGQYQEQVSQTAQLNRELQQKVDELEMEQQIRSSLQSPLSPPPAHNLQAAMSSVAILDENKVHQIITNSQDAFRIEIKQLLDNQFSTLTHLIQTAPPRPLTSPTPLGTASIGIPGLPTSSIATVLPGVTSNPIIINSYDKAEEVEQRKLSNPVLTPPAIREWKLGFDVYANNPNRRMSMYEAFGKQALRNLMVMYPEPIPIDDVHFNLYLHEKFLKTQNLFSDIKLAVLTNAMKKETPLTVESLHTYLAGFCASISPFSDEIAFRATDQDLHKTLIQAFYDGIVHVAFRKKLEETFCSTWPAARQNFQNCLTPTNVQLALAQNKAYFASKQDNPRSNTKPDYEGKKALSATTTKGKKEPTMDLVPTISIDNPRKPPDKRQHKSIDQILSGVVPKILAPCKNCRQKDHLTFDCPLPTCYDCRDNDETYDHFQSQCVHRIWKENRIAKLARQAARNVLDDYAFEDSDEEHYTDDDT
jgi:hypothetical protein